MLDGDSLAFVDQLTVIVLRVSHEDLLSAYTCSGMKASKGERMPPVIAARAIAQHWRWVLEEEWQKVHHCRILMGDQVSRRTKKVFQCALSKVDDVGTIP